MNIDASVNRRILQFVEDNFMAGYPVIADFSTSEFSFKEYFRFDQFLKSEVREDEEDIRLCYEEQEFKKHTVDLIVAFDTFTGVHNLRKTIKAMTRALKPGGEIFLAIPFLAPENAQREDLHRLSLAGIKEYLKGFELIAVEKAGNSAYTAYKIFAESARSFLRKVRLAILNIFYLPFLNLTYFKRRCAEDDVMYYKVLVKAVKR